MTVEGALTIRGETEPVAIDAELTDDRVRGSATVVQAGRGIKPYSTFLGALKLADEAGVEFDAALVPIGGDSGAATDANPLLPDWSIDGSARRPTRRRTCQMRTRALPVGHGSLTDPVSRGDPIEDQARRLHASEDASAGGVGFFRSWRVVVRGYEGDVPDIM